MSELIVPVKQGEELNLQFNVKQDGEAMDISDYTVRFQVKKAPLVTQPAIIDKEITLESEMDIDGIITDPTDGGFIVHLLKRDTSFPTGDYALVISLEGENYVDIISSKCSNKAIYRICEQ